VAGADMALNVRVSGDSTSLSMRMTEKPQTKANYNARATRIPGLYIASHGFKTVTPRP
jgi:hypothetical protein